MKKLSWFNKIVYFFNIVLIILTVLAYLLPFLAPKIFPLLSVVTLTLPLFFIFNFLFFFYWLIQFKKQMLVSGLIILLGITFFNKFYKFSEKNVVEEESDFTVMSYNVRLFNLFDWIPRDNVGEEILHFVNEKNPDILCIQEFNESANVEFRVYKNRFVFMQGKKIKTGQAIFSKYKIINKGNIEFPESDNLVIFADIKVGNDTVRVYNMHLQSIKISPDVSEIQDSVSINQSKSEMLFKRISKAFMQQQNQAEILTNHTKECPYPMLICGDMNNSAFSYVYRKIRGSLNDNFEEAGKGFGATYNFKLYPARIDYIFSDKKMVVKQFETFNSFNNSDHYPIFTRLKFED